MKCNKKCMCSICLSNEMQQECMCSQKYVYQMKCNKKCMCSQNICLSNEMQQEMYV